jgi:monoamine oxidase
MIETAIIGGGVCGLALARDLWRQGRDFMVFEARDRLGGRVLTRLCRRAGLAVDLGPTWFWPESQPRLAGLIAELGLVAFPQYDEGVSLTLPDADSAPAPLAAGRVHEGAHRLRGGMDSLIQALARALPAERIRLGHALVGLADRGDHVELAFRADGGALSLRARRVVLALPPRLVAEHIAFAPDLEGEIRAALGEAPTWMAAQAKVAIGYSRAVWREAGRSGNAFVTHEQAVVGEIFDACGEAAGDEGNAALGGFLALPPDLRRSFRDGLPLLLDSQMSQVFGSGLGEGEVHYQDWADEPWTCAALDRAEPDAERSQAANPLLRRSLWGGRLFLGGAETARAQGGLVEGALEAAGRIALSLSPDRGSPVSVEEGSGNAAVLADFDAWVGAQADPAFDRYRAALLRALAPGWDGVTRAALLAAVTETFGAALDRVAEMALDLAGVAVEKGRCALTPRLQRPFDSFLKTVLDDGLAFNRASRALADFPAEQNPSRDDVQAILRDIAAAWRDFSLSLNRLLLNKTEAVPFRMRG